MNSEPKIKISHYAAISGELISQGHAEQVLGEWMIPANATAIEPPEVANGFAAVFSEESQSWSVVEDNRGRSYWPAGSVYGSRPITISRLGESIPADSSTAPPEIPPVVELDGLSQKFRAFYDAIKGAIAPPHLADVYQLKAAAASRVLAGNQEESDRSLLEPEATARGITVAELSAQIQQKSAHAKCIAGLLESGRARFNAQLAQSPSPEAVQSATALLDQIRAEVSAKQK